MTDTYIFVIAEQVADWIADQRIGKGSFEDFVFGMTPEGRAVADAALDGIQQAGLIDHDYSSTDMVECQGWRKVKTTILFSKQSIESLYQAAIKAVGGNDGPDI